MTKIYKISYVFCGVEGYVDNGITLYLKSGKMLSVAQKYNTRHEFSMNEFLLLAVCSKLIFREKTATDMITESYQQKEIYQ